MFVSMIIVFREAMEAGLIVGIVDDRLDDRVRPAASA